MKALANCKNVFGDQISPQYQRRIKAYLRNPTSDTWDDIAGIIIDARSNTVWNAVVELDPTFPRQGRKVDMEGNILRDWERIPTPFQVLQAIKTFTTQGG